MFAHNAIKSGRPIHCHRRSYEPQTRKRNASGLGDRDEGAALGWLQPVPAALIQEAIDVAVILNALRALVPAHGRATAKIAEEAGRELHRDHVALIRSLDRLRGALLGLRVVIHLRARAAGAIGALRGRVGRPSWRCPTSAARRRCRRR